MKLIKLLLKILILTMVGCTSNKSIDTNREQDIDNLISSMTLKEKMNLLHASGSFQSGGIERLGIEGLIMSDGPHGIRHENGNDYVKDSIDTDSVTYLPTGITLSSTWNKELGEEFGKVLGAEAKARGKDIILGPGVNIIRSPLCGRNFEYLSEDPHLSAKMGVGYIKGVQSQGVSACVKHYVANNQEVNRGTVNVNVDEQTLREIYLPAFKAAIEEANAYSIMGAYNRFRSEFCSHNDYLVNEILRKEMGFDGLMISDWGAVHDTKQALENGTDIEMGTDLKMDIIDYNKFYLADSAIAMVENGLIDEALVDDKVRRILKLVFKIRDFKRTEEAKTNLPQHQQVALQVAEEGIVLLKNEEILPLRKASIKKILVVGDNATRKHAEEGGSSQVKALYEVTPLQGLNNYLGDDVSIDYAQGYIPTLENKANEQLILEALNKAELADVVIYVGGWIHNIGDMWKGKAYDCEAGDKANIDLLFGQQELINRLAEVNGNLVVTIVGGSNVSMSGWMDNAKAILHAWYPGMEGGTALSNILFGEVCPSGKLPMTFADSHEEYPAHVIGEFPGENDEVTYNEGILVGYRYFDTKHIEPVFPFGFGLSYTTFSFQDLQLNKNQDNIRLNFILENTGSIDGAEVVQVYVHKKDTKVNRATKELKAFDKIKLTANSKQQVNMQIPISDLQYFSNESNRWELEPGEYEILVGNSSRDIFLKGTIAL
ncbi:glycoside hydrolase family 3 C-terminal domain-containing protein [Bacteroidales bacterium]|nr:glycoside hydrolase family 3 C-terminal domain-containing protein [Bacteroidales bacterium]